MKLTALVTLSLVTAVMLVDFDPTWAFRLQNSQNPEGRQQSDKHDALIMTNNGARVKGGLGPNSIHGIGGSEIWPPPIPIWSFLPSNKKSSPSDSSLSSSSSSSSLSSPSSSSTSSSSSSSLNKNKRQSYKDSSSAADHRLSYLESSAPSSSNLKSSSPIMSHMSHHRNSVLHQEPLLHHDHDHDSMMEVDVDGHNNEHNGLLLEEDEEEEEPWVRNLKRSQQPSGEVMIRKSEDSKRAKRDYDVPQIECQPAADGMEMFACPNPDKLGRYRCIDDHVLCDGFVDCPNGEDEDRQACMFYKTTKAHLDVLADALLRWARGKKR